MKKYLFAALALTALVACSKDDGPTDSVLTSSEKSVTITIANMASGTRTAISSTAIATDQAHETSWDCTTIDDKFYIIFLDNSNKIVTFYSGTDLNADGNPYGGTDGQYIFNGLPNTVTKVVAVGNLTNVTLTTGTELIPETTWPIAENQDLVTADWDELKNKLFMLRVN